MSNIKILLTGASGYIGGAILTEILKSNDALVQNASVSALVRRTEQADLLSTQGVTPILFKALDEVETLEKVASDFDVVVNCASAFNFKAAEALIKGLGQRKAKEGKDVYFIHTSGTSSVGDTRISGKYTETRILSDKENIYAYEKYREDLESYQQRKTDIVVVETGLATGVKTYIIMAPTIYGLGSGPFKQLSIQIPKLIRTAIKTGHAEFVGAGEAHWNHVHISDVATLFELVLRSALGGKELPSGKEGIYFVETGEHTWLELAERVAKAGFELGVVQSPSPARISLEKSAEQWGNGSLQIGELGWASSSRTRAVLSREIGWKPTKSRADFEATFLTEFKVILEQQ